MLDEGRKALAHEALSMHFSELLQYGSRGTAVTDAQRRLIALGYNVGQTGADGAFGPGTKTAVMKFNADKLYRSATVLDDEALAVLDRLTSSISLPPAAQPKPAAEPLPPESTATTSPIPLGLIAAGAGGLVLLFLLTSGHSRQRSMSGYRLRRRARR